eukprot:scaffold23647_cov51-Attheya_sp.AAC.3
MGACSDLVDSFATLGVTSALPSSFVVVVVVDASTSILPFLACLVRANQSQRSLFGEKRAKPNELRWLNVGIIPSCTLNSNSRATKRICHP